MDINYRMVGLKRLQEKAMAAPGLMATRNAEALRSAVELVKKITIAHTPVGPGHFGTHLIESYETSVELTLKKSIGTLKTGQIQGRFLEFGTRPHEIAPRRGSVLSFGGHAYAKVKHPGEKAKHIMRKALTEAKPAIRGFFVGATLAVTESMAGRGE